MSIQALLVDGVLVIASTQTTDTTETTTITPEEPQLRPGLEETDVTPGLLGFLVTFGIALAIIFILLNMTKRLRRLGHSTGNSHRVTAEFDGARPTRPGAPASAGPVADAVTTAGTTDADQPSAGSGTESDQAK